MFEPLRVAVVRQHAQALRVHGAVEQALPGEAVDDLERVRAVAREEARRLTRAHLHDKQQVGRLELLDEAPRCGPRRARPAHVHVQVVEYQREHARRRREVVRRRRCQALAVGGHGNGIRQRDEPRRVHVRDERSDRLDLAVLADLEVLRPETAHRLAVGVGDEDAHLDARHLRTEQRLVDTDVLFTGRRIGKRE